MEFKEYYDILGISPSATAKDIRSAYKKQSLRRRPDRNIGQDTTRQMQDVNEAYTILSNAESRQRYDGEYARFCKSRSEQRPHKDPRPEPEQKEDPSSGGIAYDYEVCDEELRQNINEVRKSAAEYVSELKEALRRDSKVAADAAFDEIKGYAIGILILTVFGLLLLLCMGEV